MAPLSALILIPAAHPGGVGREPGEAGAGEAPHIVGAGCLYHKVQLIPIGKSGLK